jgi:hypothetical protein
MRLIRFPTLPVKIPVMKHPDGQLKLGTESHFGLLYPEYLLAAVVSAGEVGHDPAETTLLGFELFIWPNQFAMGNITLELDHSSKDWEYFHDDIIPRVLHGLTAVLQ